MAIAAEANEAHARPCCLCDLAGDIRRLNTSVVNVPFAPQGMVSRAQWNRDFAGTSQQDANEGYFIVLDRCNRVDEDALKRLDLDEFHTAKYSTPLWHIFGGLSSNETHCLACSRSSQTLEVFYTLGLNIPDQARPSVESALRFHCRTAPDAGRCACGVLGRQTTTASVLRWPSALTLGVNRSEDNGLQKISTMLSFQLTLSITDGPTYDLRGVVLHQGPSVTSGHYTAYVCAHDRTWFYCNDASKPREATEAEVLSAEAYTLCYEKR